MTRKRTIGITALGGLLLAGVIATSIAVAGSGGTAPERTPAVSRGGDRAVRAGDVLAVVDYANAAGFHEMAESLAKGELESRYLHTVGKVRAVVGAVAWQKPLAAKARLFARDLKALEAALANENAKAAAKAGEAVHSSQHAFSEAAIGTLGRFPSAPSVGDVLAGVNYLGAVGFHEMTETLAEGTIEPRYLEKVRAALTVVKAVAWPSNLRTQVRAFSSDLRALAGALAKENKKAAAKAGEAVHASEHAFVSAAVERLGKLPARSGVAGFVAGIGYLDAVGFHEMTETLAEGTIEPRYLEKVRAALTVVKAVAWPKALQRPTAQFARQLRSLARALASENAGAAAKAGEGVHASQHGLSDGMLAALGIKPVSSRDARGGSARLTVEITDWAFEPKVLRVSKGKKVTIRLVNRGKMPHGLYVPELKVNIGVPAGATRTITITPKAKGQFQFICNQPMCGTAAQHAGMQGRLTVT